MINSSNSGPSDRAAGRRFAAGPDGTVWDRTDAGLDERGRMAGLFVHVIDARDAVEALNDHDAARVRVQHCQRADRAEQALLDCRSELDRCQQMNQDLDRDRLEARRELERAAHERAVALQDRDMEHRSELAAVRRDLQAELERVRGQVKNLAGQLAAVRKAAAPTVTVTAAPVRGDQAW